MILGNAPCDGSQSARDKNVFTVYGAGEGYQASYCSLETRLLLNGLYKIELPAMKAREKECRLKQTRLSEELQEMKQRERNAEHAIIVYTTLPREFREKGETDAATERRINGLELFKQRAYQQLIGYWAPAIPGRYAQ